MGQPAFPTLYQVPARIWLGELSGQPGRPLPLDQVPDAVLDDLASQGFDWLWLLGVWQTGPAGTGVARTQTAGRAELAQLLPEFRDEDVCGSPLAVRGYTAHADFGGNAALLRFRQRLHARDIRLMLDFVPNHTALDHPWAWEHPEYYVRGEEADRTRAPQNYSRVETWYGPRVLAHGRDPSFAGWPDTLQLNYRHPALRSAMLNELARIADLCDGVRCDRAMLVLPEVFQRTWGHASVPADDAPPADAPFWPEAVGRVRQRHPQFLFLAEAYWDLEWTLQQQGFDYTYDKRLYDRLKAQDAEAVRGHLRASPDFLRKTAHFLENQDEPRAAAVFPPAVQAAAAVLAYLAPGLRIFQEGQLEGRRHRSAVQLTRRRPETADPEVRGFYTRLLDCLRHPEARSGRWQLIACRPDGAGDKGWARLLAFTWQEEPADPGREGAPERRLLVVVNYGPDRGRGVVPLPVANRPGQKYYLRDLLGPVRLERDGAELATRGLALEMPAWGYHVFEVQAL